MIGEPFVEDGGIGNAAIDHPASPTAGGQKAGCLPAWKAE
jgi:hypothetical protein